MYVQPSESHHRINFIPQLQGEVEQTEVTISKRK